LDSQATLLSKKFLAKFNKNILISKSKNNLKIISENNLKKFLYKMFLLVLKWQHLEGESNSGRKDAYGYGLDKKSNRYNYAFGTIA